MKQSMVEKTEVKMDYAKHEREYSRLQKARVRSKKQTDLKHEYQMLYNLLCMMYEKGEERSSLTKDEYQSDNAKARYGMIEH